MKTLTLTALSIILLAQVGWGQGLTIKGADTVKFGINFVSYDNSKEIFSFRITADTSLLKPVDTNYYTIANQLYREVTYKFKDVKPKEMLIRSYNNGHDNWIIFSFTIWDDDKKTNK